jgi:hypothetical protein
MTDSITNGPSLTGTVYAPYSTLISNCSSLFSFSSLSAQELITLSEPQITAISANYYSNISFTASFSKARTTLYSTSSIIITFSSPILTDYSQCTFHPNFDIFWTSTVDPTKTIFTLVPSQIVAGFSSIPYTINCTQLITNANNITINVVWKDGTYILQTTANNITIQHTNINNVTTNVVGTVINKNYNTPSYLGEYTLNFLVNTTNTTIMKIYINFYPLHVHSTFL